MIKLYTEPYIAPQLKYAALGDASLCVSSFTGVGTADIDDSDVELNYGGWDYD